MKRRYHKCYICGGREHKYKKKYVYIVSEFFDIIRDRYIGANDFWICPKDYSINLKNIHSEDRYTKFKWLA